jgi:hypothetical protein
MTRSRSMVVRSAALIAPASAGEPPDGTRTIGLMQDGCLGREARCQMFHRFRGQAVHVPPDFRWCWRGLGASWG